LRRAHAIVRRKGNAHLSRDTFRRFFALRSGRLPEGPEFRKFFEKLYVYPLWRISQNLLTPGGDAKRPRPVSSIKAALPK
jgi:hypothetical protein